MFSTDDEAIADLFSERLLRFLATNWPTNEEVKLVYYMKQFVQERPVVDLVIYNEIKRTNRALLVFLGFVVQQPWFWNPATGKDLCALDDHAALLEKIAEKVERNVPIDREDIGFFSALPEAMNELANHARLAGKAFAQQALKLQERIYGQGRDHQRKDHQVQDFGNAFPFFDPDQKPSRQDWEKIKAFAKARKLPAAARKVEAACKEKAKKSEDKRTQDESQETYKTLFAQAAFFSYMASVITRTSRELLGVRTFLVSSKKESALTHRNALPVRRPAKRACHLRLVR